MSGTESSTPAPEPEVFTLKETAAFLRMGERSCREALIRGEIPGGHKIGAHWRVSAVALRRWKYGEESAALLSPTVKTAVVRLSPEERARLKRALSRVIDAAIDAAIDELAAEGSPDA